MKFDEFRKRFNSSVRKPPSDEEHRIQCTCVRWFRLKYPHLFARLFAVPNGGRRDGITGARLKAEGVLPGVAAHDTAETQRPVSCAANRNEDPERQAKRHAEVVGAGGLRRRRIQVRRVQEFGGLHKGSRGIYC